MQTLEESSLSRIHQHTQDRNIGMITAHRAENTPEQNKAGNKELEGNIKKAGHGFVKVKGRYIENHGKPEAKAVDEHSYLVIGKRGDDKGELKNFLTTHGEKHGQDSILHKAANEPTAKLHGTKEGGWPGKGETHDVGTFHPNRAGEFHTAMKGKRTFAFESITLEEDGYKPVNVGGNEVPKHKEPLIDIDVDGVKKHLTAKEVLALKKIQKEDWKVKYIDRLFGE